jgi:hypothetical protein
LALVAERVGWKAGARTPLEVRQTWEDLQNIAA